MVGKPAMSSCSIECKLDTCEAARQRSSRGAIPRVPMFGEGLVGHAPYGPTSPPG
jgi:hypothetical protein